MNTLRRKDGHARIDTGQDLWAEGCEIGKDVPLIGALGGAKKHDMNGLQFGNRTLRSETRLL